MGEFQGWEGKAKQNGLNNQDKDQVNQVLRNWRFFMEVAEFYSRFNLYDSTQTHQEFEQIFKDVNTKKIAKQEMDIYEENANAEASAGQSVFNGSNNNTQIAQLQENRNSRTEEEAFS